MDKRKVKKNLKKARGKIRENRRELFAAALGIAAILSLRYLTTAALIISVFLVAFTVNYLRMWVYGIELATLTTVLVGMVFGPHAGALTGLITIVGHMAFGKYMGIYFFWLVPSFIAAGFIAGTSTLPVFETGVRILAGLHVVFLTCTVFFSREQLPSYVFYGLVNIFVNMALFERVAPVLLRMMG